jgi:hypothetical protein
MEYGSGYVLTCDSCLGLLSLSCVYYSPHFLSSSLLLPFSWLVLSWYIPCHLFVFSCFVLFLSWELRGNFLPSLFPSLSSNPSRVRVRVRVGVLHYVVTLAVSVPLFFLPLVPSLQLNTPAPPVWVLPWVKVLGS